MNQTDSSKSPRFYFGLPRLLSRIAGGSSERSENNYVEAWIGGVGFYSVTYCFLFDHAGKMDSFLGQLSVAALLIFVVWILWLLVFYFNALVIRATRALAFSRTAPRHVQHVMMSILATAAAIDLACIESGFRVVGLAWLAVVTANLVAALLLKLVSVRDDAGA